MIRFCFKGINLVNRYLAYLARVFLSLVVSGAEERLSDNLFVSGPGEHVLALLVLDDRNTHLMQDAGNAAT